MNHVSLCSTMFAGLMAAALPLSGASNLPSFPGAEGYGALVAGGRGGTIYHVTNLNDSGTGSFRDAVSQSNRMVVFDVGGYANLKTPIAVSSNITVAGQTAPGEGFGVYGQHVSLSNSSNIIMRYIRVRQGIGGDSGKSSIMMSGTKNAILDHMSIEWGRWDCMDIGSAANITVQNSIIGEGVAPQQFGCLCESGTLTLKGNLWINNESRNPKGKGDPVQYINNVVYNWGAASGYVGGHSGADQYVDMIGNYFIAGPSSAVTNFMTGFAATDIVYQTGNMVDLDLDGHLNGRAVTDTDFTTRTATISNTPRANPTIPVTVHSANDAYAKIVAGAGASLRRDGVDTRLMSYVTSLGKLGQLTKSELTVGGPGTLTGGTPPADTNGDGMSNAWKTAHGLNLGEPSDANNISSTGYTNLEDYLNSLVPAAAAADVSTSVAATTSGFTYNRLNQTFNGTLYVKNTSATAIAGPIEVAITNLTSGATLMNADGTNAEGAPFFVLPDSGAGLASGSSLSVAVQVKNPSMGAFTFNRTTYSGAF